MAGKITILSHDLSGNCFGRAYLLARVLSRRYKVEIVGPYSGKGIWPPCSDLSGLEVKAIKGSNYPGFVTSINDLIKMITGDIIYAIKIRPTSFGIGILKHTTGKLPLVLDIDDWELGFHFQKRGYQRIEKSLNIINPNSFLYCLLLDKLTSLADKITTVSSFLQNRYGGVIIPHGKDTNALDPAKYDRMTAKRKIDVEKYRVIMFLGTPRNYKGLEDVLQAVQTLNRKDVIFLIVGGNLDGAYEKYLLNIGKDNVRIQGGIPFDDVPFYLSAADIVVIPQRDTPVTRAQVPAKVFDAMAMAKPIIATRISMLPEILDGCGCLIDAGNVDQLAASLEYLLSNPTEAGELGLLARERCATHYSWDRMEEDLARIFDAY